MTDKERFDALRKEMEKLRRGRNDSLINVSNMEWYSLFKEEIRNSIAIEGVFTNRTDLIEVLEKNKRTDQRKAAAILGYFEAASAMYDYAVHQHREGEFSLRMSDVKQIHTMLMRYDRELGTQVGQVGEFRNTRVEVSQSRFTPISEFYVRPVMELLIKWVNAHLKKKVYDPVVLSAIAHVWFESIHPFRDGNGRSGRILLSYILIGSGLVNIAIKGISKSDRDSYYDALETADNAFESMHRRMEQGEQFGVEDIDSCVKMEDQRAFKDIVVSRLEDAIARLRNIDTRHVDRHAELPLSDLGRLYQYSPDYLRNLINRGKLRGHKKGKVWYVRVQDMAAYVDRLNSGGE
jgi:Fic family protein